MATLTCQQERLWDIRGQMDLLLDDHWKEVGRARPLAIDWAKLYGIERLGAMRCYTLRADGRLVGYWVGMIQPALHYRDSLTACEDGSYIVPQYRGAALRLFRFVERKLLALGVDLVHHRVKPEKNNKGRFLKLLGYRLTEEVWSKELLDSAERGSDG